MGGMVVKRYGLGIDIGGTFTDLVLYDSASGEQYSHKQLTTPSDPTVGGHGRRRSFIVGDQY